MELHAEVDVVVDAVDAVDVVDVVIEATVEVETVTVVVDLIEFLRLRERERCLRVGLFRPRL